MTGTRPQVIDNALVMTILEHWLGDPEQIDFIHQFGTKELDKLGGNATRGFSFAMEHMIQLTLIVVSDPLGDIGEQLRAVVRKARAEVQDSLTDHEKVAAGRREAEAHAAITRAETIVSDASDAIRLAEVAREELEAERKALAGRKNGARRK